MGQPYRIFVLGRDDPDGVFVRPMDAGVRTTRSEPFPSVPSLLIRPPSIPGSKRALDLIGALILLPILAPFSLVVALLIWLDSPGPVFFTQMRRLSLSSPQFRMYKFRTMQPEEEGSVHTSCSKTGYDPRITRLGRILRRYSIDEIPQLLNVLKGNMSLVGPRPLPSEDFRADRHIADLAHLWSIRSGAQPGMTGIWQISGRSNLTLREMLLMDGDYIRHQSLALDLRILARTIPAVLFGEGAY